MKNFFNWRYKFTFIHHKIKNRKKLTPQTIFTPTKHPHASSTRLDSIESSSNDKQKPSNESNHSRNIFSASKTRYTNSASLSGHRRTGAITISEYDNVSRLLHVI